MKHTLLLITTLLLQTSLSLGQTTGKLSGQIKNYARQSLWLYRCYGDTLLLFDSTVTNAQGNFSLTYPLSRKNGNIPALYKVVLQGNQSFYLLNNDPIVEIKTVYQSHPYLNIATDSLQIVSSTAQANRQLQQFQQLQMAINIADGFLLKMMRLYPTFDPFHPQIVDTYHQRYKAMQQFVTQSTLPPEVSKIAQAYYTPHNPDWTQPDYWRDSIIAAHYFDYFNPADSFYLYTNILPEKMERYLQLRTNKVNAYNQPVFSEELVAQAAIEFVQQTRSNEPNYVFCLNYYLKKFKKEHLETAFLHLYETFLQNHNEGDCGSYLPQPLVWARQKANTLKNVQIGSTAPNFDIAQGQLSLYGLQSNYTLLVFWASWCPHCTQELPQVKQLTDSINRQLQNTGENLLTVAISLDTNQTEWQNFVKTNQLLSWFNVSELKGWKGKVPKQYNVYATPTFFVLDKDKKIIARPTSAEELKRWFKENLEL